MSRPSKPLLETLAELSEPDPETGCWNWIGAKTKDGYGLVKRNGKCTTAHRAMYELFHGKTLPKEIDVLHVCDNNGCINPRDLFEGTQTDNMQDMIRKGRLSDHRRGMITVEERIAKVRAVKSGASTEDIARQFSVGWRTVLRWRQNIARQDALDDCDISISCPASNVNHSIQYAHKVNRRDRKA